MKQSKLFYKTKKEDSKQTDALSHALLTKAGFIDQLSAGIYTFLPLGLKVLKKIEEIIRQEMKAVRGQEILMPALNPKENWNQTGRWESFDVLFKVQGANKKDYALAPTHEEIISPLAKKVILSYKDLPLYLFQIQTKFRNELRAKSGILRTREFLMKDLYSFHTDEEDLEKYYSKVAESYTKIFNRLGIESFKTFASGGNFSKYSHEYQTLTEAGEDIIYICNNCKIAINKEIKGEFKKCPECGKPDFREEKASEVGNIFKLGTKYSLPFDLKFTNKNGEEKPVIMGCYGIGLTRVLGTIVEVNHDDKGIVWPKEVAPFDIHLLEISESAGKIYKELEDEGFGVLYDDRQDKSAGEKFAEADLIGIPLRIVVSSKTLEKDSVEIKRRNKEKLELVKIKDLVKYLKS